LLAGAEGATAPETLRHPGPQGGWHSGKQARPGTYGPGPHRRRKLRPNL